MNLLISLRFCLESVGTFVVILYMVGLLGQGGDHNQEMVDLKAEAVNLLQDIAINLAHLHDFVDHANNVGLLIRIDNTIETCQTEAAKVFALQPPNPPPEDDESDTHSTTTSTSST